MSVSYRSNGSTGSTSSRKYCLTTPATTLMSFHDCGFCRSTGASRQ